MTKQMLSYPTCWKQKEDDDWFIERSTATLSLFVEKEYSKDKLVAEWNNIKLSSNDYEGERDELPTLEKNNKPVLSSCICKAKQILKRNNPEWIDRTQESMREEMRVRNDTLHSLMVDRLQEVVSPPFFKLVVNKNTRYAYSTKYNINSDNAKNNEHTN